MAESRNLVLQLLITAKDEASSLFGKVFKALNDSTNVIATQVRAGFTNLFGGAVDSAAAFEQQLGKVQAKGDETYQNTAQLKAGLQTLAAQFGITGTEAAQGMEVLAAAGLNATDAMKALPAVLNLAKMENLSLDDAATKLADTLSIVGLGFDQAGRMADVLAKGANISTASAASLAEALSVAGGNAKSAGLDLEATVAALDLLHSAGIKGSAAGTSLSAVLTQLQNPASTASKELSKLGIHTRDLGGVLDGLSAAGVASGAAILGFGETAGPGLQAMISKGSAALTGYETQLRNSGGAAQEAADKLGQNFNSALGNLAAAWDSVKVALAEPILKPIADGAREVATALNTALTDGALKPVQAAIQAFAENGVAAIRQFVGSFDFSTVLPALQNFATSASEWLGNVKSAGQTAADVISGAWNTLAATFNGVAAAVSGVATLIVGDFVLIVNGLNRIGLVSDETTAKWEAGFESMKQRTEELAANAVRDGRQAGEAFVRLGTDTDTAGVALENLKNKLPTAEMKMLVEEVTAYADLLRTATPGTEQAAFYTEKLRLAQEALAEATRTATGATKDHAAATETNHQATVASTAAATQAKPVFEEYSALWQKNAAGATQLTEAHGKLGTGTVEVARVVGGASVGMTEWNGTLVKSNAGVTALWDGLTQFTPTVRTVSEVTAEYARRIAYATDMAAGWNPGMELNGVKMLGLRDAAQATAEKLAYLTSIKATLVDGDQQIAAATAESKAALDRYNTALGEHITQLEAKQAAVERSSALEQKGYDLLIQQAKAEEELANLKGDTTSATAAQTKATELQNQSAAAAIAKKNEEIAVYAELIAATKEQLAADGELNQADQAQLATMADTLTGMNQERDSMAQSLQATKDLTEAKKAKKEADEAAAIAAKEAADAEKEAEGQRAAAGAAFTNVLNGWIERLNALSPASRAAFDGFVQGIDVASASVEQLQDRTIKSMDEMGLAVRNLGSGGFVDWANEVAIKALQIEQNFLSQKIAVDSAAESLNRFADTGGNVAEAERLIAQYGEGANTELGLLNEQDLSNLRSALDAANQKLQDMQQEAQDAQTALAEMNAEILAESGNTAGAERLKLQIEESQKLADLEQKRLVAEQSGNKEAARTYQEMIAKLNELYNLKNENLTAELAGADKTTKTNKATISQAGELATALERTTTAAAALNNVPLDGLHGRLQQLGESVNNLRSVL